MISSGYYLLDEYMKYSNTIYALLVGNPKYMPECIKNNSRIFFSSNYDVDGISKDIMCIGIKFKYIFCIDDKFVDRIGDISKKTGILTFQISGQITRDKYLLKQYLKKNDILYPITQVFMNYSEVKNCKNISFPVVLKPSNSYGSNGVFLVKTREELLQYSKRIFMQNMIHRKYYHDGIGQLLCEEYISGDEYAVDVIWNDGIPICTMISSRLHNVVGNMFPDYVYYIDKDLSSEKKDEITRIVHSVGHAIGIQYGVTHTELREMNEKLYVLENAVRPGGGGCMYELHRNKTQIEYFNMYMDTMMSKKINFYLRDEKKITSGYYFFLTYANSNFGKVKEIGIREDELSEKIEIYNKHFLISPGEIIIPNEDGMQYTIFVFGIIYANEKKEFIKLITVLNDACYIITEEEMKI